MMWQDISRGLKAKFSWLCPYDASFLSAGGVLLTDDVELVPGNPATTLPSQAIIAAGKSTFPPTLGLFVSPPVLG